MRKKDWSKRPEAEYQAYLIKKLYNQLEVDMVLKNDPNYVQGIPDLLIEKYGKVAWLEVKRSENEPHQPNQDHYIANLDGFTSFIFPECEDLIFEELRRYFECDV